MQYPKVRSKKNEEKGQNEPFTPSANIWLAVKRDIEAKIITGEYAVGAKIPTIVELVEQYSIGKTTAQKIINALYDEGTIVKKVGIGCFVKPFVKERLLEQHEKELERQIENAIAEAVLIGFDKEYVIKLIDETWKKSVKERKDCPFK